MRIELSLHSLERIKERKIDRSIVIKAINFPDKIENSVVNKKRFLIKKIYYHRVWKKDHLLMVIAEREKGSLKVVTIIDTSKISKYF